MGDVVKRFQVGDRVVKNPALWRPSAHDAWGLGGGVGVVRADRLESSFRGGISVQWPSGRCYHHARELLPAPDSES